MLKRPTESTEALEIPPILPEEPRPLGDIKDALVIKEGEIFLLTDASGNVPLHNLSGFGLYRGDTRYLSGYHLTLEHATPTVLLSTAQLGYSSQQDLTNPEMVGTRGEMIPAETLEIRRLRQVDAVSVGELLTITSYNMEPVTIDLHLSFDADFADVFEVRGWSRPRRGEYLPHLIENDSITYRYRGLDGVERQTSIGFSPAPSTFRGTTAVFHLELSHRRPVSLQINFTLDGRCRPQNIADTFESQFAAYRSWLDSATRVWSDNEFFNATIERSLLDLRLLRSPLDDYHYIAAGIPWYATLFGRDSLITGLQTLAYNPAIARETLLLLASMQGTELRPDRDEEPGKILHEVRTGEMARLGEIPMTPYYGTVDATPLWLVLLAEYLRWTGDLETVRTLMPNAERALAWIVEWGDRDRDGYVEYLKYSPTGIANQGWKDSHDSIVHADGALAEAPIALVEVQAYVYAARLGMATVFEALGEPGRAKEQRRLARRLREQFNRDFWVPQLEYYALALDGQKRQVASVSSNVGHALWCGIIEPERAGLAADRLLANDLFSGWGIRTLSSSNPRYNPLGYHIGSVWPHDNALAAMGMKRYGFEPEVNEIATALFDVARSFDYYRLPELFCGPSRTGHDYPVRYPVACRPQAWAAGSMLMLLQAILGLEPDALHNCLTVRRPSLPHWLRDVELRGLRVGNGSVDLVFSRRRGVTRMAVLGTRGDVKVRQTGK